jgi:predicted DNA-binding mobile mystery protein A
MSKMKGLKLRQLSMAVKEGRAVPIDKLGQRLRDIREVLGMTQKQLAKRIGIGQPLLSRIEEDVSSCALKTVARIAAALECEFLGVVTSRQALELMIKKQAAKKANGLIKRTFANMALEKQAPGQKSYDYQLKKMIEELSANPGPELWEE